MTLLTALLAGITLLVTVVQFVCFRRLARYVERELEKTHPRFNPKTALILPCKGLDPGFRDNIQRLLGQSHDNFEIIFAVASETDPAYAPLKELTEKSKAASRIVVAGVSPLRAQKLNNQLCALEQISDDTEVLVFADSDVIARPDFLKHLVTPLADETVGASTGYRFYLATPYNWASILRSLWNRMTAWELVNPGSSFAWGGAMAIRRETFDRARVRDAWVRSADDDLSLTTCVKKLGLTVRFVPQCLVTTDGDASIGEIIEWTNRQLVLTKVYYPKLWMRGIVRAWLFVAWLMLMLAAGSIYAFSGDQSSLYALLAGMTIIPVEVMFLLKAKGLWQRVLSESKQHLSESLVSSILAIPLAHLVLPFVTLASLTTNRIHWRGITYELLGPNDIRIIAK